MCSDCKGNKKGWIPREENSLFFSYTNFYRTPIITYNLLNLPIKLTISNSLDSATNTYMYSADGRKLKTVQQWSSTNSKRTDYCGNMIYVNGILKRILVDGGYIEGGVYYFYLADHEGNNRVVANASGTVVQANHYYPFGMPFTEGNATSSQPYKYNGKELDTERGLNLYDYGARLYDPVLARWTTPDPKAEKYYAVSNYIYVDDNPIAYLDPDGNEKIHALYLNDKKNRAIVKEDANKFDDNKKVINIWAHGNSSEIFIYYNTEKKENSIKNPKDFVKFLNANSKIWKNSKNKKELSIVLHSCDTGKESDEKEISIARLLSKGLKDVNIYAPTGELQPIGDGKEKVIEGNWHEYENGKVINIYNANSQPGSKGFNDSSNADFWKRMTYLINKLLK
jgi:RHS repeat-associated protein